MADKLTDEQLIAQFRSGDGGACDEILMRYKNKVLAIARGYFLSDGDTEDLVQEGMCGLYSAITAFSGEGSFAPFAYTCIRNRIIDAFKHSRGNVPALVLQSFSEEEEGGVSFAFSPEDALINSEESRELNELMKSSLSKLELKAIEMYVEGATMNEIATSLNLTYKQLDNALSRAKNKLKKIRKI
ncbi:MAG: sigma-70 family RNA polymerase sigma factor [Candidatus Coproplasma sp.]